MSIPRILERFPRSAGVLATIVLGAVVLAVVLNGRGPTPAVAEESVEVQRRTFSSSVVALGAVKPQIGAEVRVGSRLSGRVRRLTANVGDRVERGQIIAELETVEYDAAVALREAELRQAASVLVAAAAFDPGSVARAEAELRQAEATATLAAQSWTRYEQLLRTQGVSASEAEVVFERHRVAQAGLEAARNALDLTRSGGAEQRRQAEASLDRARAALESAVVERSFASIRAPISGVVASVATQEGETVAAGLSAPTFLTIVDLERLQVEAYVDEVDIGKVKPGLQVTFTVDAFPALDFGGRVSAVYPSAVIQDNVVRYVTAVAIESQYGGHLRPDMTANVRILLDSREVLAVPARAVRREGNANVVHVLSNGRAEPRTVRIGWRDGVWVEVVEGLEAGARILLDPPSTP
jgi:multidrug efflux pump subunit AcrA (membrane-fusion protein)